MSLADILTRAEVQHERLKQSNVVLTRSVLSRLTLVSVYPPKERHTTDKASSTPQSTATEEPAKAMAAKRAERDSSQKSKQLGSKSGLVFMFKTSVDRSDCNTWNTMHGGCVATLFNLAGKIAVASMVGGRPRITTNDLTTNYIAPAVLGSTIFLECECIKVGRSLAYLNSKIWDSSHRLLYYATQTIIIEG